VSRYLGQADLGFPVIRDCSKWVIYYFLCRKIGRPTVRIKIPANTRRKLMITPAVFT